MNSWLDPDPVRVLYEFDGPKIFICEDAAENPYLAYQCGEGQQRMRFLVVPFNPGREEALTTGAMDLREALLQPKGWIVDLRYDWTVDRAWNVETKNLPAEILPKAGVMLWAHLPPRITEKLPQPVLGEASPPNN